MKVFNYAYLFFNTNLNITALFYTIVHLILLIYVIFYYYLL